MDASVENGNGQPSRAVIKGKMDGDDPQSHLSYRFYGRWQEREYRGQVEKQFAFDTFVKAAPHSRAGVITYLKNAPNVGHIIAGRLFDKFGGNAVKILREQPEVAAAACERLSVDAAIEAARWLEREKALEDCTIELVDLLAGRGFPKATIKEAVKIFGNRAAEVLRSDPYKIMRFRGCGFKRADAMYLDMGHPAAKLKRQAYCATYAATQQTSQSGDTWIYRKVVEIGLAGAIAGADAKVERAIELAERGGIMAVTYTDGVDGPPAWDGSCMWVADARKARSEQRLAAFVVEALEEQTSWPVEIEVGDMSDHQIEEASKATKGALGIIGGSPGTGKTFTAAQLIRGLGEEFGWSQIACAAPTGKAAVRLTEAMNAYRIPLVARTIHSLLKVESSGDGGWSFAFNRSNPLPFKVLVIDEASMIDTDLAASLFAARARGTLMLILGDVNQLPPVGHGAPLRDMIAAGVPYGELREIRRNSGGIVQACADIRDGKPFKCEGNLELVAAPAAKQQRDAMLATIDGKARAFGVDPVWGVQVLCAVNKKSDLSRRELNKILQNHLNPNPAINGSPFRYKDKVICVKNSWLPLVEIASRNGKGQVELVDNDDNLTVNDKGQVYVANGEMGEVVQVEPGFFHVQLTAPRRLVVVPRGKAEEPKEDAAGDEEGNVEESTGTGCDWELGYAVSVHKSQGSEWPVIIYMVDESGGAKRICTREHIYTGISRAKQCCVLVGKLSVAQSFTKRTATDKRRTFLAWRIQEGRRPL